MRARQAIYLAAATGVVMFAGGWVVGLVDSTRINTVAAQAYVQALDLQVESEHEKAISTKWFACQQQVTDLRAEIAEGTRTSAEAAAELRVAMKHAADLADRIAGRAGR